MWNTAILNLPHLSYGRALEVMQKLVAHKGTVQYPQVLMLVEHEPVITLGRRSGQKDFVVSEKCLLQRGVGVHRIERGGLATYHGPGQLVVYPVFDLRTMKVGVLQMVSGLERSVIDALAEFGIKGESRPGYRGVWVGAEKIASVGIAVRRGISFHGIALNAAPDLDYFDLIHPCGIPDVRMTSIARITHQSVDIERLRQNVADKIALIFSLNYEPISLNRLMEDLQHRGDGRR